MIERFNWRFPVASTSNLRADIKRVFHYHRGLGMWIKCREGLVVDCSCKTIVSIHAYLVASNPELPEEWRDRNYFFKQNLITLRCYDHAMPIDNSKVV